MSKEETWFVVEVNGEKVYKTKSEEVAMREYNKLTKEMQSCWIKDSIPKSVSVYKLMQQTMFC